MDSYKSKMFTFSVLFGNVVKVVKVILVIFIFGLCHLLTIYKY